MFFTKGFGIGTGKKRDFRATVILQTLIIFSALLLKDIFLLFGIENSYVFRDSLFLLLGAIYVLILWHLLTNFTNNKILQYALLAVIIATYALALVTLNPFYSLFPTEQEEQPYLFIIHFVLFIVEATVIVFSILDIFSEDRLSQEKLWGSACIYLMIALCFGSIYDLINIAKPGSFGVPVHLGLESYSECIYYSMTVLAGMDNIYGDSIKLIRNIGVLEALWGNLFIVLLVGRLLSQPSD